MDFDLVALLEIDLLHGHDLATALDPEGVVPWIGGARDADDGCGEGLAVEGDRHLGHRRPAEPEGDRGDAREQLLLLFLGAGDGALEGVGRLGWELCLARGAEALGRLHQAAQQQQAAASSSAGGGASQPSDDEVADAEIVDDDGEERSA